MKNFGKKWFISASSGILGKILLVAFGLGVGFVGSQFISVPIDSDIIKGAGIVVGFVVIWFAIFSPMFFPMILEFFAYRRESENEQIKLKNENLQLENENLKLKLELEQHQRNQQSTPDNEE